MISKALLARFESPAQGDLALRELLLRARPMVDQEPGTAAWFAIRFARGDYGIFDVFADDHGLQAHLDGRVAPTAIAEHPTIQRMEVLAYKPADIGLADASKGLLLTFKAKEGREAEVAAFLRAARRYVAAEEGTRAWFALQLDAQHFGIFDVFPDGGARLAHLAGQVPRELAKNALSLLGGMPEMHMVDVLCFSGKPESLH